MIEEVSVSTFVLFSLNTIIASPLLLFLKLVIVRYLCKILYFPSKSNYCKLILFRYFMQKATKLSSPEILNN